MSPCSICAPYGSAINVIQVFNNMRGFVFFKRNSAVLAESMSALSGNTLCTSSTKSVN